MSNHPPDRQRPRPVCQDGNEATNQSLRHHHIEVAAEILSGSIIGLLLALLAVQWIDDSLGVEPGHVEHVVEAAHE